MAQFWPDKYMELTEEQRHDLIVEICGKIQRAIDDGGLMPSFLHVTPTLEVSVDDKVNLNPYIDERPLERYLIPNYVVDFDSVVQLVEDRLFSNPDFYDKAYELLYEKYMDYTPDNIERAAREIYESRKFSIEAYLEEEARLRRLDPGPLDDADYDLDEDEADDDIPDLPEDQPEEDPLPPSALGSGGEKSNADCKFFGDTVSAEALEFHGIMPTVNHVPADDDRTTYLWHVLLIIDEDEIYPFNLYDRDVEGPVYFDYRYDWRIDAESKEASALVKRHLEHKLDCFRKRIPY